jgi:hypothetical protein
MRKYKGLRAARMKPGPDTNLPCYVEERLFRAAYGDAEDISPFRAGAEALKTETIA